YEPASERERRALGRETRYDLRGREQEREQPGLEEERVPLEPQECLSRHGEREVADPYEKKDGCLGHAREKKEGEHDARPAQPLEHPIARAEPAQGGE